MFILLHEMFALSCAERKKTLVSVPRQARLPYRAYMTLDPNLLEFVYGAFSSKQSKSSSLTFTFA